MIILKNARIYTQNNRQPFAEAIMIDKGKIIALGENKDISSFTTNDNTIIDLDGKTILPGLCDSHLHLAYLGKFLSAVNCETTTKAACLENVRKRAAKTPPGTWIYGHGWNQNTWPEGFGHKQELDSISTQHPIYLSAKSLHAGWANSAALKAAGIDDHTPNPPGGEFGRDEDGSLNGLLFENAIFEVEAAIPQPDRFEMAKIINAAQEHLCQFGITAVHDFDRIPCFQGLQTLEAENRLKLRVLKTIPVKQLRHFVESGLLFGFGSDYLKLGQVKLFADGALGPQTAAMLAPYENQPGNTGSLLISADEIFEAGKIAVQNQLGLAVHAIGDLANRVVLDGFEKIRQYEKEQNLPAALHRIEHVQLIHPEDIPRIRQLNLIASMQPIHLLSDMDTADTYWGSRSAWAYAFNSIKNSGAPLVFGSDAPVESANPFVGMFSALVRRQVNSPSKEAWYPEQKLEILPIIQAYTTEPAKTAGWGSSIGHLSPGCHADLIVLPEDPHLCSPKDLFNLKPVRTMVSGEWVWQSEE